MNISTPQKQQGVALAVSLIFLVLITIIGITSIRGTTMNELMSANAQQKSATFQIAESVIEGVWDTGYILKNTSTVLVNPPVQDINFHKDSNSEDPEGEFNFNNMFDVPAHGSTPKTEVTANATLQYCGESFEQLGSQLNASTDIPANVAHIFSVHGVGAIAATNASSNHDQRGFLMGPETGRTGNCP